MSAPRPIYILSFRQRDELAALAIGAGWAPDAGRRRERAEERFLATGATLAVVDARGALTEGLAGAAAIGGAVSANGGAMLVLLSRGDGGALSDFLDAGATHFLMSPHSEAEFLQALRYAWRHVERVHGAPAAFTPVESEPELQTQRRDSAFARQWLTRQLAHAGNGEVHVALVALSRFDILNTAYGRDSGDQLLGSVERRLTDVVAESFGRNAIVARLDGPEFLLGATGPRAAVAGAVEAVSAAMARPFVIGDTVAAAGARIGVASSRGDDTAATLMRRASETLAEARGSEANVRFDGQTADTLSIETLAIDIHGAFDRDEIHVLFQPQVAVATGAIVGVEALVRWEHRESGSLGAELLFAAAERADVSVALSDHIQKRALASAAAWPAALGDLRLAINITAADIARVGFADLLLDRIDASGFPRNRLTVEITESGLIDDLGQAAQLFATLRAAGLRVAIDDFGTGYSSLAYLKALPLDYLKIDRHLAQDIAGSARDRIVVRGVIEMARSLGLAVIAEGVESAEQLALLAREGCQYYQGFLCAEPLAVEALSRLVTGE